MLWRIRPKSRLARLLVINLLCPLVCCGLRSTGEGGFTFPLVGGDDPLPLPAALKQRNLQNMHLRRLVAALLYNP